MGLGRGPGWVGRVWRGVELWVDKMDQVWGNCRGSGRIETLEGLPGRGRSGLWVVRLGLVHTAQLPLWASPLAPTSYLKLRLQGVALGGRVLS